MIDFELQSMVFMIEILLAEIIFLFAFPKKKMFWLRYLIAVSVSCVISGYLWTTINLIPIPIPELKTFIRFFSLFLVSYLGMLLCFKASPLVIFSVCVAGYGVEHIAYHITKIIQIAGAFNDISFTIVNPRITREVFSFPFVYLAAFFIFGLQTKKIESYKNYNLINNVISVVTILIGLGITRLIKNVSDPLTNLGISLYAITCCSFAILMQFNIYRYNNLKEENRLISFVIKEQKKQYDISQQNIEIINAKVHDLKHRLAEFEHKLPQEEIDAMKNAIDIYDTGINTGYNALDVLIKEKNLMCKNEGIRLTCLGNGEALNFVSQSDAYALFGNAIDNAIEAVRKVSEPGKKIISITIEDKKDLCNINISNYYEGVINFSEGMPKTTKSDEEGYHGFGLKSIKSIAEKYHGGINMSAEDNIFSLNIYLFKL